MDNNICFGQQQDPRNLQTYLERNIFLPDINNELDTKNATYVKHLTSLNALVMFMFSDDITVKPKETAVSLFCFLKQLSFFDVLLMLCISYFSFNNNSGLASRMRMARVSI